MQIPYTIIVYYIYLWYNIIPEKELPLTYNWVSLFRFPIWVGRDPDRHQKKDSSIVD